MGRRRGSIGTTTSATAVCDGGRDMLWWSWALFLLQSTRPGQVRRCTFSRLLRSCSITSTQRQRHRHTHNARARRQPALCQGPQLPQICLLPAARVSAPLPCFLSRTMKWKPPPPQQPPAPPNLGALGHTADMSPARGLLAAGWIRKQTQGACPFLGGSSRHPCTPTPRYMCYKCVCALCARCKSYRASRSQNSASYEIPRRIEAGRPCKVVARFAAPPWGCCDRRAHVCVSASDAR